MNARPAANGKLPRNGIKPVLVVGLGATGASCARYFSRLGQPVRVVDSRATPPGLAALDALSESLDLRLGGFDLAVLDGARKKLQVGGLEPGSSCRGLFEAC
jgi:UDP-N-acetylmuramoylalanine--D-glutamate ligase